jgi:hypothetical protein
MPIILQFFLAVIGVVVLAGFASGLLEGHYWSRRASSTITTRLDRARKASMELGIQSGKGHLRKRLYKLERQKLGLLGRLRYARARGRLLDPTPTKVLRSHSRRDYHRKVICQFVLRPIRLFQPYGIVSVENVCILLLAGTSVMILNQHAAGLNGELAHLRTIIPWHSIAEWTKEWYALISLVVVILIVSPKSPLVDHIRARDESAKDTNRLLAQLYGKLSNVERSAYWYLEKVDANRARIVKMAVLKATNGLYTWTHGEGLAPPANRWETEPEQLPYEESDQLEKACKELSDHLTEYRGNGLHTVAYRMMRPVSSSLFACWITFDNAEMNAGMRTQLLLDQFGRNVPLIGNWVEEMVEAEHRGNDEDRERLRILADNAARDFASGVDANLASAYVTLRHLHRINYYLNRRLHGTTRTRLAGSLIR